MYLGDAIKDPAEVLDYQIEWSAWLNGDTLQTVAVTADAGVTVDSVSHDTAQVVVWISALAEMETWYAVACTVTTAAGRTGRRRFRVKAAYL